MIKKETIDNVTDRVDEQTMRYLMNYDNSRAINQPVQLTIDNKIAQDTIAYQMLKDIMQIPGTINILDSNCSTGKTYATMQIAKETGALTIYVVPTNAQIRQFTSDYKCRMITSETKQCARMQGESIFTHDCNVYITNPELAASVIDGATKFFGYAPKHIIIDEAHVSLHTMANHRGLGVSNLVHAIMQGINCGANVLLMSGTPDAYSYIKADNYLQIHSRNQHKINNLHIYNIDRKSNNKVAYADIYVHQLMQILSTTHAPLIVYLNNDTLTSVMATKLNSMGIVTGCINRYSMQHQDVISQSLIMHNILPHNYQIIFATSCIDAGINIKPNPALAHQYIPVLINDKADNVDVASNVQFLARLRYDVDCAYIIRKHVNTNYQLQDNYLQTELDKIFKYHRTFYHNVTRNDYESQTEYQNQYNYNIVRYNSNGVAYTDYFLAWYIAYRNCNRFLYFACNQGHFLNYLSTKLNIGSIDTNIIDYSNASRYDFGPMYTDNRYNKKVNRIDFVTKLKNNKQLTKDFLHCNLENKDVANFVINDKSAASKVRLALCADKDNVYANALLDAYVNGASQKQTEKAYFDLVKDQLMQDNVLANMIQITNNPTAANNIIATSKNRDILRQLQDDKIAKEIIQMAKNQSIDKITTVLQESDNLYQLRTSKLERHMDDVLLEMRMGNNQVGNCTLGARETYVVYDYLTYHQDDKLVLKKDTLTMDDYKTIVELLNNITYFYHGTYTLEKMIPYIDMAVETLKTRQTLSLAEMFEVLEKQQPEMLTPAYYQRKAIYLANGKNYIM